MGLEWQPYVRLTAFQIYCPVYVLLSQAKKTSGVLKSGSPKGWPKPMKNRKLRNF